MRKILLATLLLLACTSAAHAERLVTDPFDPGGAICGDPSQMQVVYYVVGAPFPVSNPIAAQSDTSLSLDVSATPVGGPYTLMIARNYSCSGSPPTGQFSQLQNNAIGQFTYWHNADGTWPYSDLSNHGSLFLAQGGTGALVPASGHTGKAVLYTPLMMATPQFTNVFSAWGTSPGSVSVQLEYYQLVNQGWSITSDSVWLSVTPVSGTDGTTLTCTFNTAQMPGGIYTANVTVTSPGASNSGMTFQIYLTVDYPVRVSNASTVIAGLLYLGAQQVLLGTSAVTISGHPYIY